MVNCCGIGFDSHLTQRVNLQKNQGKRNKSIYAASLIQTIKFDALLITSACLYNFLYVYLRKNFITMVATNISDFRSNIRQYVDQVLNDGSTVIINRGNTAAVLISLDEYNSIRATEDLITTGTTPAEVENGIAALTSGSGIPVNIDEL